MSEHNARSHMEVYNKPHHQVHHNKTHTNRRMHSLHFSLVNPVHPSHNNQTKYYASLIQQYHTYSFRFMRVIVKKAALLCSLYLSYRNVKLFYTWEWKLPCFHSVGFVNCGVQHSFFFFSLGEHKVALWNVIVYRIASIISTKQTGWNLFGLSCAGKSKSFNAIENENRHSFDCYKNFHRREIRNCQKRKRKDIYRRKHNCFKYFDKNIKHCLSPIL